MVTVAAQGNGSFQTWFTMPPDVVKVNQINVVATANGGAVKATATYTVQYNAGVSVSPSEVVNGSVATVSGENFPAQSTIKLGVYTEGQQQVTWLTDAKTDANGSFSTTYGPISVPAGSPNIGKQFTVVAQAPNGVKAEAPQKVTVMGAPKVQVVPSSGPAGVTVAFQGQGWPANRQLTVYIQAGSGQPVTQGSNVVVTDGGGNFSTSIYVDMAYASLGGIQIIAQDPQSTAQVGATYTITQSPVPPTPVPPTAPTIQIQPGVLIPGQPVTVLGYNYPANQPVAIYLIAGSAPPALMTQTTAAGNGSFSAQFTLDPKYANAGQVTIAANSATGLATQATVPVQSSGPPPESGLPMTVRTQTYSGGNTIKVVGTSWPPGQLVTLKAMSSDQTVNQVVANITVKSNGTFDTTFPNSWVGRADLGIYATTADGKYGSSRRVPVTTLSAFTSNASATGKNWRPNVKVSAIAYINGSQADVRGSVTADANGNWSMTVNAGGIPKGSKGNYILFQTADNVLYAEIDNY
jgi:hypothetical protein